MALAALHCRSCGLSLRLAPSGRRRVPPALLLPPPPAMAAGRPAMASQSLPELWVQTGTQGVLTAALEVGATHAVFTASAAAQLAAWRRLASFEPLMQQDDGTLLDEAGNSVGRIVPVSNAAQLRAAEAAASQPGVTVMDAADWKIIPAENLVAAFQAGPGRLMAVAGGADEARVMLEALEAGVDGVLLRTEDVLQVKQLGAYLRARAAQGTPAFEYEVATVTRVQPVGMADRVCVDLCSLLQPGQGMLVGSFARALFLVHSECMEAAYIASRPFRVNAGAVHAYAAAPGGRTAYLSELMSGAEVVVADAAGRASTAVVGRCKIEARPMLLVEAETPDGARHSTLLQNAETVRLVGPADGQGAPRGAWRAVSVSELRQGQTVFVLRQDEARHTGIAIQERISEK